jgi:hypothetical protein
VHPADPRIDRRLELARAGATYAVPCAPLPAAHWWLELSDDEGRWLLRGRAQGTLLAPVELGVPGERKPEAP